MEDKDKVPVFYTPPGLDRRSDDFVGLFETFEQGIAFAQNDPHFRSKHPEIKKGDKEPNKL